MKPLFAFACSLLAGLLVYACAKDYVTGRRTFSLVSESQEIAIGREADPAIQAEYGVYDDPALAAYVDSIGQAIARVSHRPNLQYTFRIVDSPIVNAFALPGGWVYFTRGILAHFNSEDELAGVMGHEVGHVVARHGAEQMSKAQLASLALGIGSLVSEKFSRWSRLAETGVGLIFLSYGRAQESESDQLGVEYSTKLGYDAHKMAAFFRTISRISEQSGQRIPTFLSTHPDPGDREVRVNQLAGEWQQKIDYQPRNSSRFAYLRRIEGLVYGEDPRQGFVENNMFYHPTLRFQFPVPDGWKLQNSPTVVLLFEPEQKAMIQFRLAQGNNLEEAAANFLNSSGATSVGRVRKRVNDMPALVVESTLSSQSGDLRILSYFIQKEKTLYVFHSYTLSEDFSRYVGTFTAVMTAFDDLRNRAALQKKPLRIRLARVRRNASLESALQALRIPKDQHAELALLNGMNLSDQVKAGEYLKVLGE